MFPELLSLAERPSPFARMTIASLWTDPHVSEQMLRWHLNGAVDVASHRTEFIDAATTWMVGRSGLASGRRALDLGCGPGLYTSRLAAAGARVTGVDFSAGSIAHAREQAAASGLDVEYVHADYLVWKPADRFDLVTMIMRDFGAMAPNQRERLLANVRAALAPGGTFVFDVDSMAAFAARKESFGLAFEPADGFWSAGPCFELRASFVYLEERASLDRYELVEADRRREIYNWTQFFSPETLADELARAGLAVDELLGDVAGRPFDPESTQFAVVARAADARS